jgi:hypothetical protein
MEVANLKEVQETKNIVRQIHAAGDTNEYSSQIQELGGYGMIFGASENLSIRQSLCTHETIQERLKQSQETV